MADPKSEAPSLERKQKMLRGSVFLTLSPITAFFLGLFISFLIADLIPSERFGIFSWFSIMNSILVTVIPFRLPGAITRYLAVAKGSGNQEEIDDLIKSGTLMTLILAPVSGLAALVTTPLIFNGVILIGGEYEFLDVVLLAIGVMVVNMSSFSVSIMNGLQKFEKVGIAQFIANILGQATVIILIIFGFGIRALILKWVVVGLLTVVFLTLAFRKIWSLQGKTYPLRPLLKFAYPGIIAFLFAFFFQEYLIRFIFQLFGSEELGLYAFAMRLFTFVNSLRLGFYSALSPYYAEAVGREKAVGLEREVQWTMKISFFIFIPLIIGMVIITPPFFQILFENYYWSYPIFAILMIGLFFSLYSKPYLAILNALAKTQHVLVISIISSVVSGLLMLWVVNLGVFVTLPGQLSEELLLVVAAYASSWPLAAALAGLWVKREIGINLGVRRVMPFVIIAIGMLLSAVLIHFLRLAPLIELAAVLGVCSLLYLVPIRVFKIITADEIRKATLLLPKRLATPATRVLIWIFAGEKKDVKTRSKQT
jgi:O-antigen/teichoic acid export membrane protein